MADRGVRGVFPVLLVLYLLAFAAFLVYAILRPPEELLPVFLWRALFLRAAVLLADALTPLTVAGVALACSLWSARRASLRHPGPFHQLAGSTLSLLVGLAVVYTVVALGLSPLGRQRLEDLRQQSRSARIYLDQAREQAAARQYGAAVASYDRYLDIDPRNRVVAEERDAAHLQELKRGAQQASPEPREGEANVAEASEPSAYEYLQKAENALQQGDYFTAHYYASLASEQNPGEPRARRVAAEAWQHISDPRLRSSAERKDAELFQRKEEALDLFRKESYIAAYYSFRQLAEEVPGDPDVRVYLDKSREKVEEKSFFLDELPRFDALPGATGLLFVNPLPEGDPQDERELVSIGRMVVREGEGFFRDIEVIRFRSGELIGHYAAPYGKLFSDGGLSAIIMNGIDRSERNEGVGPTYFRAPARGAEPAGVLRLGVDTEELASLRAASSPLATAGFAALWRLRRESREVGYLEAPLTLELLLRLLEPFTFLILSLLAVALGWAYRARFGGGPPAAAYLLFPLLPVVAAMLVSLYRHGQRVVLAFLTVSAGFPAALAAMLAIQAVLLLGSLFLLAGQRTE